MSYAGPGRTPERCHASQDAYTLHDGPPYANGCAVWPVPAFLSQFTLFFSGLRPFAAHRDTHLGHALNKILKSFIVQYQLLRGRRARYVPGWDCHGLPIELKVLQALSDEQRRALSPLQLRRKARDFALKTVKAQRAQFQRRVPQPPTPPPPPPSHCLRADLGQRGHRSLCLGL